MIEVNEVALMKMLFLVGIIIGHMLGWSIAHLCFYFQCKRCDKIFEKNNK